ncbi:Hachiman antiphage defense system protein HamA [Polaromonas sp. CG_23.6]|uniref:Hachiman antiphage defense system protein HamA n=1 Tax=Polaromonas sp. CG_23.6 TaxID=2760709 RepID=UPI0024744756|nr:Hachiman antiphage defense system protein HamA [Polaromonas sp. CG_23.6]MDH6185309.1 hypothetical protein [Polaromonas sp. CG_23.6]
MSNDLGLSFHATAGWFSAVKRPSYVFVSVTNAHAAALPTALGMAIRRCYISDDRVNIQAIQYPPATQVIAAALPDPGSVMSGEFGEILTYFYQGATALPKAAVGLRRWHLKQDRNKAAPYSDVVHLVLPNWPTSSAMDTVLCSEVKAKSTKSKFEPIKNAIEGCETDRTSRLAGTLVWLRERAITGATEGASVAQLNRFIKLAGLPPTVKKFQAVAVVCDSLVTEEAAKAPATASPDYEVVVISVPKLKATYEAAYTAAMNAVPSAVATAKITNTK